MLAESEGFEGTELLAGRARWRQSSGLPEAIRPVPAIRAAGRDAAKRWPWRESRSPTRHSLRRRRWRRVRDSKSLNHRLSFWPGETARGAVAPGTESRVIRAAGGDTAQRWPRRESPCNELLPPNTERGGFEVTESPAFVLARGDSPGAVGLNQRREGADPRAPPWAGTSCAQASGEHSASAWLEDRPGLTPPFMLAALSR